MWQKIMKYPINPTAVDPNNPYPQFREVCETGGGKQCTEPLLALLH